MAVDAIKMAERFYEKAEQALDAITPEKIEKTRAVDLARIAGIFHENARIASGKSVQSILSITGTLSELARLRQKGEIKDVPIEISTKCVEVSEVQSGIGGTVYTSEGKDSVLPKGDEVHVVQGNRVGDIPGKQ